ncbi:hypothetical protein HDU97_009562, partial [Phlyctochytrium planicorne]
MPTKSKLSKTKKEKQKAPCKPAKSAKPALPRKEKVDQIKLRELEDVKLAEKLQRKLDDEASKQVKRDEAFARVLQREERERLFGRMDSGVGIGGSVEVKNVKPSTSISAQSAPLPKEKYKEGQWTKVQSKKGKKGGMNDARPSTVPVPAPIIVAPA